MAKVPLVLLPSHTFVKEVLQGFQAPQGAPQGENTKGTFVKGHLCAYLTIKRNLKIIDKPKKTKIIKKVMKKIKEIKTKIGEMLTDTGICKMNARAETICHDSQIPFPQSSTLTK